MEDQVLLTGGLKTILKIPTAQELLIAQIGDITTKSHIADNSSFWKIFLKLLILAKSQLVLKFLVLMFSCNNCHMLIKPYLGQLLPTKKNGTRLSSSMSAPET